MFGSCLWWGYTIGTTRRHRWSHQSLVFFWLLVLLSVFVARVCAAPLCSSPLKKNQRIDQPLTPDQPFTPPTLRHFPGRGHVPLFETGQRFLKGAWGQRYQATLKNNWSTTTFSRRLITTNDRITFYEWVRFCYSRLHSQTPSDSDRKRTRWSP